MRVLSLFDGMACGMLALQRAGIEVDRYVAYEVDKFAIKTSSHNFPNIEHKGDVFKADFTEYNGLIDWLVARLAHIGALPRQRTERQPQAVLVGSCFRNTLGH